MEYAKETLEKIADYKARGFEIVENKNWKYDQAKCRAHLEIVRLAQTNSRYNARIIKRIVWAVK